MIRRTQEEWQGLIEQQQNSGLSANQFCKQHQLCAKHFSKRKVALKKEAVSTLFVKVNKPVSRTHSLSQQSLILKQGEWELRIPSSVSTRWLASLIAELR